MSGTERTVLKGVQNPCSQSPLLLEADETPQFSSVNQVSLKSKVLKFGSLENGDMHLQEDPLTQGRPAPDKPVAQQETQSKVPQFDVWKGEGEADYNQCFDNVGKNNIGNMLTPKQSDAPQLNSDDCEAFDPLDNQQDGRIDERVRPLAKVDDQQDCGGGRRSTVDQIGIPISITESESLLLEEFKLMQPNIKASPENEVRVQMKHDIHTPAQLNGDMHLPKDPSTVNEPRYMPCANPPRNRHHTGESLSYGRGSTESQEPLRYARFPLLDEDLIDERGRPLHQDYGGCRTLTVNQRYPGAYYVAQIRSAPRGFPISTTGSTTPLQTKSNLIMQSNVEATSRRIPHNLSTNDHPNQVKKNGSWLSCFGIRIKTTNQNNSRKRDT